MLIVIMFMVESIFGVVVEIAGVRESFVPRTPRRCKKIAFPFHYLQRDRHYSWMLSHSYADMTGSLLQADRPRSTEATATTTLPRFK